MLIPSPVKQGDKVIIVAPSGRLHKDDLNPVIALLKSWGLTVLIGDHVFDDYGFFASDDDGRRVDLQSALDGNNVKVILCARGGFGLGRIIDSLDFQAFISNPKWLVGFSDITLLHMKLHSLAIASIHGPVARQLGKKVDQQSIDSLKNVLFNGSSIHYQTDPQELNKAGEAEGQLIGGNLTMICNNIGTNSDIEFENKILFIEDINESVYSIDRHMNHLLRAQKISNLAGLIIGQFTNTKDTMPPYKMSTNEVILEYVAEFDYPVCFGFPAGHETTNLSLPISFQTRLEVAETGGKVSFN